MFNVRLLTVRRRSAITAPRSPLQTNHIGISATAKVLVAAGLNPVMVGYNVLCPLKSV